MGSKPSKQMKYHASRRTLEYKGIANLIREASSQTDVVRILPVVGELSQAVQTDAESIQPVVLAVKQRGDESGTTVDADSSFSEIASLASETCDSNPATKATFSPSLSTCLAPIGPNSPPVPTKRKQLIKRELRSDIIQSRPNLDAGKFECCLWVPVEDVARVFANTKDRRMEAIARACNCQFVLTDTHRLTKMLGVQQLVCIVSDLKNDMEKCRNLVDDRFPAFYVKSTRIVDRPVMT